MRPPPAVAFQGLAETDLITGAATPPASSALLAQADAWPVAIAMGPYVGCGRLFDTGTSGAPATRYLIGVVAPGAERAKYAIGCATNSTPAAATNFLAATATGGLTGNDIAEIVDNHAAVHVIDPATLVKQHFNVSGDQDDTAPATKIDRLLELPSKRTVELERMEVQNCSMFAWFTARQAADLETLDP